MNNNDNDIKECESKNIFNHQIMDEIHSELRTWRYDELI